MTLKIRIRDFVCECLCLIPFDYLDKLRLYQFKRGIFASIAGFFVANVIRYRRIDSNIKTFSLPDSTDIKFHNDGSFISRQIFWRGMRGYEYLEVKLWRLLCANAKVVVEMGANIGFYTVVGASSSKDIRYTAIEANPNTVELLKSNISLNSLKNVDIIAAAVVGQMKDQSVEMVIPTAEKNECAPAGAYLLGGEIKNRQANRSIKVDVIEAKNVIGKADLIKLDIEGHEFSVLNSIDHEICSLRPIIMIEILRKTPKLRNLISKLASEQNYEIYAVGNKQLHKISALEIKTIVLQDTYQTRDTLILPAEKISAVKKKIGSYVGQNS